jgi:hypothetical protein
MPKRTPTNKQRDTAKAKLLNPNLEGAKLVEAGGYGEVIQKNPARALESKGYKLALEEYGLTEKLIAESLVSDIEGKPKNRAEELRLGAKILHMTDEEKVNLNFLFQIQGMSIIKDAGQDNRISDEDRQTD